MNDWLIRTKRLVQLEVTIEHFFTLVFVVPVCTFISSFVSLVNISK